MLVERRLLRCAGCRDPFTLHYRCDDEDRGQTVALPCPRSKCNHLNEIAVPHSARDLRVGSVH